MRGRKREQKVLAAPPLIYFGGLVAGVTLDALSPLALHPAIASLDLIGANAAFGCRLAVGLIFFLGGFGLNLWAVLEFRRMETTALPWGQPSQLVLRGPYQFTRNPMYLGLTLAYVGLAITVGSIWALLLLPAVVTVIVYGVIRREESHLSWRFGDDYEAYKDRVRRWL